MRLSGASSRLSTLTRHLLLLSTKRTPTTSAQQHYYSTHHRGMASTAAGRSKILDINTRYRMNSGYDIPALGYGVACPCSYSRLFYYYDSPPINANIFCKVYQTPAAECEAVTLHAFRTGYRHVDSARYYRNEQPCGDAMRAWMKESGTTAAREELFFTTKVPPQLMGYENTLKCIESSFSQTGLDYIDLYLIHSPYGGKEARCGTWRALVEAQKAGKIRSLGVSNYGVHHLDELESYIKTSGDGSHISVGQWEVHPWLPRDDIVSWCRERNVVVEAYCPLVRGERASDAVLTKMAEKYGRTWAQVLVRWSLQKGYVPLPKSATPSRIEQNAKVYDFEISEEDMEALESPKGRYEPCSWDPTTSKD